MKKYLVFKLIILGCLIIISCGSSENTSELSLETVIMPEYYSKIKDLDTSNLKFGKKYDVTELPKSVAVSRAIYKKKDIEIREYDNHDNTIQYGEKYASSVTGKDAIVSGDEVMWKEGAKDRRKCVPRAGNSEAGCDQTPRFGGYIILGNLIILCEGLSVQESLSLCHSFKDSIIP